MDWVYRPQNYKGLYGILQLLQGSHLDKFLNLAGLLLLHKHFSCNVSGFQSNQYKKLAPVLSRFCNVVTSK